MPKPKDRNEALKELIGDIAAEVGNWYNGYDANKAMDNILHVLSVDSLKERGLSWLGDDDE